MFGQSGVGNPQNTSGNYTPVENASSYTMYNTPEDYNRITNYPYMQDYYANRGKKGFIDRNLTRNPSFQRYNLMEASELVPPATQTVVNDYLLSPFNAGKAAIGMANDFVTQRGNAGPGQPLNIPTRIRTAVKDLVTFFDRLSKPGKGKAEQTVNKPSQYKTNVKDLMQTAKSNKEKM